MKFLKRVGPVRFSELNARVRLAEGKTSGQSSRVEAMERRQLLSAAVLNTIPLPGEYVNGETPQSQLVMDANGNLFGTTSGGGSAGDGTVFEIAHGTTTLTYIASFNGVDGATPLAGVTLDSSGDIFGTTSSGGANNAGTVFEIVNGATTITTLGTFDGTAGSNGAFPQSALSLDSSGDIFGATPGNDSTGLGGTVFEIVHDTSTITTLATFPAYVFGPDSSLVPVIGGISADSSGDVFGTAGVSSNGSGYVFEIAHGTTTITNLGPLDGNRNIANDGTGVIRDSSGNLFGATQADGSSGDGTIFEIHHGTSTVTILADFDGTNGTNPSGLLQLDSSGNLFGTTQSGGANGDGTVFELAAGSSAITDIADFNGTNGASSVAGVALDASGDLFGTTTLGGSSNQGTVFEIAAGQTSIATVDSFDSYSSGYGVQPAAGITINSSGDLFSSASTGGANASGTVFEIQSGSTAINTIGTLNSATTGNNPGGVAVDPNGNIFGATDYGGAGEAGTIFEIPAGTDSVSTLITLQQSADYYVTGSVTLDAAGDLFGTTQYSGAEPQNQSGDDGSVFELTPGSTSLGILATFGVGNTGENPEAGVTLDSSGDIFGTTSTGGANGDGTVFEISGGNLTTLASFDGTNGRDSVAGVILDSSGDIFGTTYYGGTDDSGTAFEIVHGTDTITTLVNFDGTNGEHPSGLALDAAGNLFGTTGNSAGIDYENASSNVGTVFEIPHGTSTINTLATFNGTNGADPPAGVTIDSDGNLWGTTEFGGANGSGTVFEIAGVATPVAAASVVIVPQVSPATATGSATVTATVAPASGTGPTPTGTIAFYQNGIELGTGAVASNGQATLSLSDLQEGTSQLTAYYTGDTNYASSNSSPATFVVNPIPTLVTLSTSSNPASADAPAVFTATVTGMSDNSQAPSGSVLFYEDGTLLGTEPVQTNGQATFTAENLIAGTHALTAEYAGDSIFAVSTSALANFVVTPLSTVTASLKSLKLPALLVSGQKVNIRVPVVLTNSGNVLAGKFTVSVYANLDTSLDGNQTLLKTFSGTISLKHGRSKTVNLQVGSLLGNLPVGDYHFLAEVTDPTGARSLVASAGTIAIASPFITLTKVALQTNLPSTVAGSSRTRAQVQLTLENSGNIPLTGKTQINLFLSDDGTLASGILIRSVNLSLVLKPGATRKIRVALLRLPMVTSGQYSLLAQVTHPENTPGSQFSIFVQYPVEFSLI